MPLLGCCHSISPNIGRPVCIATSVNTLAVALVKTHTIKVGFRK
jgi:hypothetical protein